GSYLERVIGLDLKVELIAQRPEELVYDSGRADDTGLRDIAFQKLRQEPEKRDIRIDDPLDARSLDFDDDLLAALKNGGVDLRDARGGQGLFAELIKDILKRASQLFFDHFLD